MKVYLCSNRLGFKIDIAMADHSAQDPSSEYGTEEHVVIANHEVDPVAFGNAHGLEENGIAANGSRLHVNAPRSMPCTI